jgi:mannose-1-phosphate guanylyltransferase
MRAVLLAAGLGTRLRPLTDTTPKCLVPIHGQPLLAYWLDALFADGQIDRVLINTHHLAEQVQAFVANSPWHNRIDLFHEDQLHGTGGTLLANRAWFGNEAFLVIHADNLTDASIVSLIEAHRQAGSDILMTMLTFRTATPQQCGIVELDSCSRVTGFYEKVEHPPGNLANGAVYVFSPDVLDHMTAKRQSALDLSTEVIPDLLPHIFAFEHTGFFMDIGSPSALEQAQLTFPQPATVDRRSL